MAKSSYGSGSVFLRGKIWWVQVWVDNKQIAQSSKSAKKSDALRLRDKLLGKKARREITGGPAEQIRISELFDDVLKSDIKESTRYIWRLVIEKNLRPFFGRVRAIRLSTDLMDKYREKRRADGVVDATVNRELSIMRTAFHNARKRTPPKVHTVPYFLITKETTVKQGFLPDEIYSSLLDALEHDLKRVFVTGYLTGIRKGELLAIQWPQVDFESGLIGLEPDETKIGEGRSLPILRGDMYDLLLAAKKERDQKWPSSPWVFNRQGKPIRDFRGGWERACIAAGVPDLNFHDLRRTAVRNMRRAGVPQVIRMKISGHKTDSMERRYNIVDGDDLDVAREFMERRMTAIQTPEKL